MIVALAGGVGAARFLEGLVQAAPPESVTVIVNTGDDAEFYGLHVSPDIDIVIYTLAGLVHPAQGWGLEGDTFHALEMLARLGRDTWFQLGDRDLATLIHRSDLLRRGQSLSEATAQIAAALDVRCTILPMSNDSVRTRVRTPSGWLAFQDYFVKQRTEPEVLEIAFEGADRATAAPGVIEAIASAERIILCPSNPLVSIGTVLSIPGLRDALRATTAPVVAISPIVGGGTIKGPADRMMRSQGMDVSPVGVARAYVDFLNVLIVDDQDSWALPEIEALGIRALATDTIMRSLEVKTRLAQTAILAEAL